MNSNKYLRKIASSMEVDIAKKSLQEEEKAIDDYYMLYGAEKE